MSSFITDKEIDDLRRLLAAADQAPWEADIINPGTMYRHWTGVFHITPKRENREIWSVEGSGEGDYIRACNAELAAAAVSWLPRLLRAVESIDIELYRATKERDAYKRTVEHG